MEDRISMRELLVLAGVGLLSPAIRALPGESATLAGNGGWLSSLAALPAALVLCWGLKRLSRGEGLLRGFTRTLGRRVGKAVMLAYLLWGVLLLGVNARLCAQRVVSTTYQNGALPIYAAVLLGAALWAARGKLAAFARAGEIFFLILCVVRGVVLLLAGLQGEGGNVLPVWIEDLPGVTKAGVGVLATLSYGVYAAFLADRVEPQGGEGRKPYRWTALFCLLLTAIQWAILGTFGPTLTASMEQPFFMMVKELGVRGVFQRGESVVMALWIFTDLVFLGTLTLSCCALAGEIFSLKSRAAPAGVVVIAALLAALVCLPSSFAAQGFAAPPAGIGNLIFGVGLPLLALGVGWCRKKQGRYVVVEEKNDK